jgi:hypothetical protein
MDAYFSADRVFAQMPQTAKCCIASTHAGDAAAPNDIE